MADIKVRRISGRLQPAKLSQTAVGTMLVVISGIKFLVAEKNVRDGIVARQDLIQVK